MVVCGERLVGSGWETVVVGWRVGERGEIDAERVLGVGWGWRRKPHSDEHTFIQAHASIRTHTRTHARTHTCTNTYTYNTHTNTHVHTQRPRDPATPSYRDTRLRDTQTPSHVWLKSAPPSSLLPAACCLLPAACCLLPAACCLLPPPQGRPAGEACWRLSCWPAQLRRRGGCF